MEKGIDARCTAEDIGRSLAEIRRKGPVVHNITNYVVMNTTANALLAVGASPVMAHAEEEAADMVNIASALVVNIGTLSPPWVAAMTVAARQARERRIPFVLDPVGAGATPYRTATARELIREVPPDIIRGNASEILALQTDTGETKGVDSTASPDAALDAARRLSRDWGSVVCISGETDHVVRGEKTVRVCNGHPMMTRVTGLGCTATALCGAFAAVEPDPLAAAFQAMAVMGIAGEVAAATASGPGSLQVHFIDALHGLTDTQIRQKLRINR